MQIRVSKIETYSIYETSTENFKYSSWLQISGAFVPKMSGEEEYLFLHTKVSNKYLIKNGYILITIIRFYIKINASLVLQNTSVFCEWVYNTRLRPPPL